MTSYRFANVNQKCIYYNTIIKILLQNIIYNYCIYENCHCISTNEIQFIIYMFYRPNIIFLLQLCYSNISIFLQKYML